MYKVARMNRWCGKVAVVTGASSGIGQAIARALISNGMVVAGLARREDQMRSCMMNAEGAEKFHPFKCDITMEQQVTDTFQRIKEQLGTVQVLVNNAGLASLGKICDLSREEWERVFDVNVFGLLECTKQVVRMLQEADAEGHVININSIQGHRVYTFGSITSNVYAATKHALTAITETLQNETSGGKIRFTSISPGLTRTEILEKIGVDGATTNLPILEAQDIAEAAVYVLGTPQRVQVTELTLRPFGERRN